MAPVEPSRCERAEPQSIAQQHKLGAVVVTHMGSHDFPEAHRGVEVQEGCAIAIRDGVHTVSHFEGSALIALAGIGFGEPDLKVGKEIH